MKKYIYPLLLAIAVFIVTVNCQPFTILRQEGLGLFLNTPDFYRALFFDPFPLSNLIGSFLVQFYSNIYVGAAIVAVMVALIFVIARAILKRLGIRLEPLAVLCAGTAWFFIAKAANPSMGIAIILCSLSFLAILALIFRGREPKTVLKPVLNIISSAIVLCAVILAIAINPSIRTGEKWSKIEFAAVQREWNYLLKHATPEDAEKDMQIVPFALLALNAEGRLADEIGTYPVMEDFGLDYGEDVSYRRSLFDAVLFSNLGCHNESIHRLHQCGDFLPHCTSFRTLRMLVEENYAVGDSLMVVKYCDILDKSVSHKSFTKYFRQNPCAQRQPNTPEESSKAELILTSDPMQIMLDMGRAGINSGMAMERYFAYHKLREYFKEH